MAPVRLGLVGCGGISERHGRAAAASDDVAIVACCDVRTELADEWSERFGCERAYRDYRTMIAEHELDGVLIATWPSRHREHILGSLEAGARRIICEKSLVMNGEEALEIWTAAQALDALVVEAFMYRHHPAIRRLEEILATGELGAVDTINAAFNMYDPGDLAPDDEARDWRQRKELGGGVPYDLACYCVDACNLFAGARPRQVVALAGTSDRYGTVDRLHGLIEYEDGPIGVVASSRRSDQNHELRIDAEHGHLMLPVAWRIESSIEVLARRSVAWGRFETTRHPIPATDAFRLQLESFAAAVRGDALSKPSLAESVVNAVTLDALLRSAAERSPMTVEVPSLLRAA
jgi:predicted dehydrogenase